MHVLPSRPWVEAGPLLAVAEMLAEVLNRALGIPSLEPTETGAA